MAQKLFIGGLSFTTTDDRLRAGFSEVGQVDSATVVMDRDTGRSRGFGFVEMATAEEAEQAIARFNGKEFDGRQIKVEKASGSPARRTGSGGFGGGSRGGNRW
jgi:RNA recognition motif-containing protein